MRGECWQIRKIIRKKYNAYLLYYIWCGITSIQYNSTSLMFAKLPTDIQWVIAIYLLITENIFPLKCKSTATYNDIKTDALALHRNSMMKL